MCWLLGFLRVKRKIKMEIIHWWENERRVKKMSDFEHNKIQFLNYQEHSNPNVNVSYDNSNCGMLSAYQ